jgi:hypothetical protein
MRGGEVRLNMWLFILILFAVLLGSGAIGGVIAVFFVNKKNKCIFGWVAGSNFSQDSGRLLRDEEKKR